MREDWDDAEWLVHLQRRACRFTACADDAADLTHDCLIAFVNHFTPVIRGSMPTRSTPGGGVA
ncbi:hypothetical protein HRbin14_00232 [bacterium HR14]|jgi:DNA-directed RNA polymerase specialized sigma24 family protein|nr:hypothetical protein HRbin14_00232 [bacterium HR14]